VSGLCQAHNEGMKKGVGFTIMQDVRDESLERRKYQRNKMIQRIATGNKRAKRK